MDHDELKGIHSTVSRIHAAVQQSDIDNLKAILDENRHRHGDQYVCQLLDPAVTGQYLLHDACRIGHEDVVLLLINYTKDINLENADKVSALNLACFSGKAWIVGILIDEGAFVSEPAKDINSPYYIATDLGHSDVLDVLLNHSCSCLAFKEDRNILLYAGCKSGCIKMVKRFLSPETDINAAIPYLQWSLSITLEQTKPIYAACKGNSTKMITFLIGQDVDITSTVVEDFPDVLLKVLEPYITENHNCDPDTSVITLVGGSNVAYLMRGNR